MRIATFATCTLNQWSMDFEGNYKRILESITLAKQRGSTFRCGPELEITGYGCGDHFYESDTFLHSWEVVAKIMSDERCRDIIIDVGMPVMHKNIAYNCRVVLLNRNVLLIRPKKKLCDSGIYRESRWFTGWMKEYLTESYVLPDVIRNINGQKSTPIGDAVICTSDTSIGFEICEELWNPDGSLIKQSLAGVEITVNSSGGFHEIGKTKDVVNVIKSATRKCGGVYIFSNLRGCDGDRMYYHGASHITINGEISVIGEQFSLKDVEVVTSSLDLDDIITYRKQLCKSSAIATYPEILIDFYISNNNTIPHTDRITSLPNYEQGEEIALGPACWLWDYLRRSNLSGILLPYSGDISSMSSAVIVYSMCNIVCKAINENNISVLSDIRKIINDPHYIPKNPKELCNKILVTCQICTDEVSDQTLNNSKQLVTQIGSNHIDFPIQSIMYDIVSLIAVSCAKIFKTEIKTHSKNVLQSNKDRITMIFMYILADLLSMTKNFSGRLLVLGGGNADTTVLGNYQKYGSFSGDISLTAGITHENLKLFLKYSENHFSLSFSEKISESDTSNLDYIGTSNDIDLLCKLKKNNCGPYSVFCKLVSTENKDKMNKLSRQVKLFFQKYSINHHKKFSTAPCLHLGSYAIGNNYYDQHQILYNTDWTWQFCAIDREVKANMNYDLFIN